MTEEEFTFALLSEFRGYSVPVMLQALHKFGYINQMSHRSTVIDYSQELFMVSKVFTIRGWEFPLHDYVRAPWI